MKQYEQVIIGAGFAGIGMGIKLKEAGYHNFIILERAPHLGGTWYANHYPGAACDVQSHLYCYSFEQNPNWSRTFSPQPEILQYMEHCANKYGVTPHIQLNTEVTGAAFNQQTGQWLVNTSGGSYLCKQLISCSGGLSRPALPDIKGIEQFKGDTFHTAQWNHRVTLEGKNVAVIGTGASAIQVVPAIAEKVKHLYLYQRTPPWILPKPDRPMRPWEKKLFKKLPFTMHLYRGLLYWRNELFATGFIKNPGIMKLARRMALRHLTGSISNPALQATLTPNYTMGCKRILLSNDYYPALNRPNVTVVTEDIEQLNAQGVQTYNGHTHPVDVVIFATGFYAAEGVVAYSIKGLNNLDLNTAWQNGAEAYLGTSVAGFPNMFLIVGPNTGLGHSSMILMIEAQINYIIQALNTTKQQNARYVDVKPAVQSSYNTQLQQQLQQTVWQTGGCQSWYQTKSGKNVTLWPGYTFTFMNRTKKFEPEKYEVVENG